MAIFATRLKPNHNLTASLKDITVHHEIAVELMILAVGHLKNYDRAQ